jgi:hypothetical protein
VLAGERTVASVNISDWLDRRLRNSDPVPFSETSKHDQLRISEYNSCPFYLTRGRSEQRGRPKLRDRRGPRKISQNGHTDRQTLEDGGVDSLQIAHCCHGVEAVEGGVGVRVGFRMCEEKEGRGSNIGGKGGWLSGCVGG